MRWKYDENYIKLNKEQKEVYEAIVESVNSNKGEQFFVYKSGRCGKTFIRQTLLCRLRSERKIVFSVASSGIAAVFLDGDERNKIITEFAKWQLAIGDGKVHSITKNPGDDDFLSNMSSYDYLRSTSILTPTNNLVDDINDFVIEKIPGKIHTYFSQDSIDDDGGEDNDFDTAFPVEYLNSINMPCLPKHEL
ncbi:uncharacterized protein LOC141719036 [Apium graveolens]|uniref:uncharacterized protein LOC141719036 n=1 Tax=Apium graveolens TaxID=4045 RepID=UPI003D79947E